MCKMMSLKPIQRIEAMGPASLTLEWGEAAGFRVRV